MAEPPRPSIGIAIPLTAALLGLAVGASLVTGAWLIFGSGGESASTAAVSAPSTVGGYVRFADVKLNQTDAAKKTVDRVGNWNLQGAERLSKSHSGAATAIESYTDEGIDNQFTVLIVRARSPFPPFVAFVDPAELGVARPNEEVLEFGDVACTVRNGTTPVGQQPKPEDTVVTACLHTNATLTVQISRPIGDNLGHSPEKVANLVNEVWSTVS